MEPLADITMARSYIKSYRAEDDAFLLSLLKACSQRIVNHTGRNFFPDPNLVNTGTTGAPVWVDTAAAVTKEFPVRRNSKFITLPDLRELVSISFGGVALVTVPGSEAYTLWGKTDQPYTSIELTNVALSPYASSNKLRVTGRWGFLAVPDDIKDALCMWVARRFKQRDANYADTVTQGIEGAAFSYSRQIPGDIKLTLDDYKARGVNIALIGA
jgi:hypothetical protein